MNKDKGGIVRELCVYQGYVPAGCLMDGFMILTLVNDKEDPCAGCNENRIKCGGRPKSGKYVDKTEKSLDELFSIDIGTCELCGKRDDLKPFGPNREKICYDCGMKDEETTAKMTDEYINDLFKETNKEE